MALSQETLNHLSAAGWYSGRQVNVEAVIQELRTSGFEVPPIAETFLNEFYGIRVARLDRPSLCVFDINPLPYIGDYQEYSKYRQQRHYEATISGPLCMVGISEISDRYVLTMDKKGCLYMTEEIAFYFSLIGETPLDGLENLLYRDDPVTENKYLSKTLSPFNDDEITRILMSKPVIACMGHKSSGSAMLGSDYSIDRWLRAEGYKVYTVNPSFEKTSDVSDDFVYRSLADVPESIDMIVCHSYKVTSQVIDEAISNGVKIIFPSFAGLLQSEESIRKVENAHIEFIDGIGIQGAHKRVIKRSVH